MNEVDARRLAEAVGEHLTQVLNPLAKTLERMNERLDAVDRRVVFLEANHHRPEIDSLRSGALKLETEVDTALAREMSERKADVATLRAEIEALTAWRNQMAGAATLFGWVRSSWPIIAGAVALLAAWLKFGGDAP